ncbi:MAG: ExbD/TolR family protein [Vicinamibacterales bacterium]|jgi:biopolymer transport protein ExbD
MKSDINVTPLIDVLLVLLIIFIVVAPVAPRALDASLPETRDTTDPAPPGLVLEVREDDFSLNSTPVLTLDELESRLRAALETRRDKRLFVRPTSDIRYSRLIAALDTATEAGASRIGLMESDGR